MHEMQTMVTDVCLSVCMSVCPSVSLAVTRGHSVQPLPNDFGLLLLSPPNRRPIVCPRLLRLTTRQHFKSVFCRSILFISRLVIYYN